MDSTQERRSRPRASVDLDMRYERDGFEHPAKLMNISITGVLLQTSRLCDPDDELLMSFRLPNAPDEISVAGRVAWGGSVEGESFGTFRIGVRFENMASPQKDQVKEFIQSVLAG